MTLIMNYRQAQTNYYNRRTLVRKTPSKCAPFWKRTNTPKKSLFSTSSPNSSRGPSPIVLTPPITPPTPPSSPSFQSQGFKPITELRTIYVGDCEYTVEIPEGYDIYEGLRVYYPELYDQVLEEESEHRLDYTQDRLTEDCEAAWDYLDYLEWLYD